MSVQIHWPLGGWYHRGLIVPQRITDPINILQTKINSLVWKVSEQKIQTTKQSKSHSGQEKPKGLSKIAYI
jgi:hypothetical protein